MRERGYLRGPVPEELGGLGAGLAETAAAQRALGRGYASTALAVNMHLFQVGVAADGFRAGGPTGPLLERIAKEGIVLGSTGAEAIVAGNWTTPTTAKPDGDDAWIIDGRKFFCSQAPGMDIVRINAADTENGDILVFAVPVNLPGVRIDETWDTTGIRATASHDLVLEHVHVPAAALGVRIPRGGAAGASRPRKRRALVRATRLGRIPRHRRGSSRPHVRVTRGRLQRPLPRPGAHGRDGRRARS